MTLIRILIRPSMPTTQAEHLQNAIDNLPDITTFIRWFFSGVVLSFVSIILSGKLLIQIPIFRLAVSASEGAVVRFPSWLVNLTAKGDEAIVGLSGFIVVLLFSGLLGGADVPVLLTNNFGLPLQHFESLCIFSSFILVAVSWLLKLLYSAKTLQAPADYEDQIDKIVAGNHKLPE